MAKVALCIWLFAGPAFVSFAQTDTASTIFTDSAKVNHVETDLSKGQKVKTWPIATTVALILISSYLLYNVRSR